MFLYVAVGSLVVARLLLYPLRPADLTPPYWVAMGATAITVLAGAHIVEMADAPMAIVTSGLVAGASVVFWAFGPWLIPPLVAASIWKHVVHRVPLRYEATLWSVVFPLGMYGVGAYRLGLAAHLPIVESIGEFEGWVALAVWTITFVAMLHHLAATIGRSGRSSHAIGAADDTHAIICRPPPVVRPPSSSVSSKPADVAEIPPDNAISTMTAWPPIARNKRDVRDDACASAVAVTTTRYGPSTRANLVFWPRPVV